MRMLSLRNLIGLGAIGGIAYYARKNGGLKNAWENIVGKAREAKDEMIGKAHDTTTQTGTSSYSSNRSTADDTGYGTGLGGSGGIRH